MKWYNSEAGFSLTSFYLSYEYLDGRSQIKVHSHSPLWLAFPYGWLFPMVGFCRHLKSPHSFHWITSLLVNKCHFIYHPSHLHVRQLLLLSQSTPTNGHRLAAPHDPWRSPIQVLTGVDVAQLNTAEQKKLCLCTGSSFPIRYINFKINLT